jgi:hypothetical protein
MTIDRNGETDPRFMVDAPKDKDMCMCCQTEEATQYWLTLNGRLRMCDDCVNSPDKDDGFLIEEIK